VRMRHRITARAELGNILLLHRINCTSPQLCVRIAAIADYRILP
jgi:hypothetical protein